MSSLAGLHAVNTRPIARGQILNHALNAQGARIDHIPLIENIPLSLSAEQRQCLLNLEQYDLVFIVSPTAAELGLALLSDYWPQWPVTVQWLAVGEATANILRDYSLEPIVPQQESSEGLLQLPILQQLQYGQKMLVLRGQGGRNLVRDNLQQQGVKVDYLDLYQRQMPMTSQHLWQQLKSLPDVVIITSGEILDSWKKMVGEVFKQIPVVVISVRLANLAQQQGFQHIITAQSTRNEDIINAIQQWHKNKTHDIE